MVEWSHALYRDALHAYLKFAYPDDDEEYYSKWAWLVPKARFFDKAYVYDNYYPKSPDGFPREVRFGCWCSGNTKLRCYTDGFMFDTNHGGDPPELVEKVKLIRDQVHEEWRRIGIPFLSSWKFIEHHVDICRVFFHRVIAVFKPRSRAWGSFIAKDATLQKRGIHIRRERFSA